jgi:DNA-binding SARP family transcriptional activator/TolB-like protein/Tfp pilus assembly protein PilF
MLRIRLFGGPVILGEDGPFAGPAAQRHRLALIALLSAAHPGAVTRDKVMAQLWPERGDSSARNLLNQAIHALRKALGEEALQSSGESIHLTAESVDCDLLQFRGALREDDCEGAVALYTAPFLDGFFIPKNPQFERWADSERKRCAEEYGEALEALAEAAVEAGDLPAGIRWLRRLAAEKPYNSEITLRLMHALAAAGDPADAVQQARMHEMRLKDDLEAEPAPEVAAFAERVRTSGGTGSAVRVPPMAGAGPPGATPAEPWPPSALSGTGTAGPPPGKMRRGLVPGGLAAFALAAMVPLAWLAARPNPEPAEADRSRGDATRAIAVLPFEDLSPDGQDDLGFVTGIHSSLVTALSGVESLTVISRASVLPYGPRSMPLRQIGEELQVDVILEGGVQRLGDQVRIDVQLSEASTGTLLWANSYARELRVRDLFTVQAEITERVVASLEASMTTTERLRIAAPSTNAITAYQYYHQALEASDGTRAGNYEAERLLRLALSIDPEYAPAWASLANHYGWRPPYFGVPISAWDSARAYAKRALEIDPGSADAYEALALTYGHQGQIARQERAAREALRLNPNSALARRRLAETKREQGDYAEALRLHRDAVRLSPNHLRYRTWVGHVYSDLENPEEAERWYRSVLALRPGYLHGLLGLAFIGVQLERPDSALHFADLLARRYPDVAFALAGSAMVAHYLRDFERSAEYAARAMGLAEPGTPVREVHTLLATTVLGYAHLRAGDPAADSLFDQSLVFLNQMIARGADSPRWPYEIALIHAARGESEEALSWLATAYERGFRWAWMLDREPMLDPVRHDVRFQGLAAQARAEVERAARDVITGGSGRPVSSPEDPDTSSVDRLRESARAG